MEDTTLFCLNNQNLNDFAVVGFIENKPTLSVDFSFILITINSN